MRFQQMEKVVIIGCFVVIIRKNVVNSIPFIEIIVQIVVIMMTFVEIRKNSTMKIGIRVPYRCAKACLRLVSWWKKLKVN
ncbi:MAG TPA: hypothetical protein DCR24_02330 [Bacillus bacterium]|nr:hypothetical protein [Bacillus sp. (in: firmicutes)]